MTENIKQKIIAHLQKMLDEKVKTAELAFELAKESRDNDTKSSAGDKYETGRAMMQLEMDKNEAQKNKILNLKRELAQIDCKKKYKKVEFGSLVFSNNGIYFISIGIGKVEVEKSDYYVISLLSPIGKILENKKIGEEFQFQKRNLVIDDIL